MTVASSAVVLGRVRLGGGAVLAQGTAVRSPAGAVAVGHDSALLENGVVIGRPESPVRIGRRTVFGHRFVVLPGATIGDLCEIGNAAVIGAGATLGDGCILGEGTVVPAGRVLAPGSVALGRPARTIRRATDEDRARVAALRDGHVDLRDDPGDDVAPTSGGTPVGTVWELRGVRPTIDPSATLLPGSEVSGDVHIGAGSIIAPGVRIIGDSHGPVRIGAGVQILEGTVLHLLPDNELVLEDEVVIGPAAMIHGCRIGRGAVVEAAAIVCDWSTVGAGSVVRAGSLVPQRARVPSGVVVSGFPAKVVAGEAPGVGPPAWAFHPGDLETLRPVD